MEKQMVREARPQSHIVSALQKEAKQNEVFGTIAYIFAKRERARSQVTLASLKQTMEKEGADWSPEQYSQALKFLADLGLGNIKYDEKGRVIGLFDVKTTLQSIGQVACAKKATLERFKPAHKNKYVEIMPEGTDFQEKTKTYKISLTVVIDGKSVVFPGPSNLPAEELGTFLVRFNSLMRKESV